MRKLREVAIITGLVLVGALLAALLVAMYGQATSAHASVLPKRLSAFYWARTQAGHPYVWGGTGPGYDCSGLVMVAFEHEGIYLPHNAAMMVQSGKLQRTTRPVKGDLAVWGPPGAPYHVEFYTRAGHSFGALTWGLPVWWHNDHWFQPSAFYHVVGSG